MRYCFLLLLAWAVPVLALGPVTSADAQPEGATSLFNGTDLSGWYTINPHAKLSENESEREAQLAEMRKDISRHWSVENNEIVNDGHGGYLTTEKEFGDIELWIEYKTVPKADSGIYLRGTPQVQIWDVNDRPEGSGGLFNNQQHLSKPLMVADKPFGEWNQFHIIQVGARTTVYLNGKLVVDNVPMENYWDRTKPLPARGPMMLQTHGGEIRWRNLYVKELSPEESNEYLRSKRGDGFQSVFNGQDLSGWAGPTENYQVVDGALLCKEGTGGTIYTEKEYGDFQVSLEFLVPPGGNNGLAIRYPGQGDTAYEGMCELQVLDNDAEKYARLDPRQYHGSAYGMVAAERGYLRSAGTWNYQEVTVRGSTIMVELNGYVILNTDLGQVTEFMGDRPHPGKDRTSGHFGFAGHGDPVQFREVAIRE